jgi:hypothetical protein
MATQNPRINITLEAQATSVLVQLAKQAHRSISSIAQELILDSLERREDFAFSMIADARDTSKAKRISHADAWK